MKKAVRILLFLLVLSSCSKEKNDSLVPDTGKKEFISAVDISAFPEISDSNPLFYNKKGQQADFITILKESGVNTIRLRLWVDPENGHSGLNEVNAFSNMLKADGFKIWLTLHYSDTWADPGHQQIPLRWRGIGFEKLKDSVYSYTSSIVNKLQPDYIQIGNEINSGLLFPYGRITLNYPQFIALLTAGISAVRANSDDAQIIIHYAGFEGSDWFFDKVNGLDYDIIGLSYYPKWHGKSLDSLKNTMVYLSETYNKEIVIAETAYPFTLEWNDWTNNLVGSDDQLILPEYPATVEGQKKFVAKIKTITNEVAKGMGFSYWGAELIAWKGPHAVDGSVWENQALFDFNNKALPVLDEFKIE